VVVEYAEHAKGLIAANPTITQVAVVALDGRVIFQTKNWDVSKDAAKLVADWKAQTPFVILCDIRYSILQCTPERIVSTNVGKKGHLVGAVTPEGYLLIARTSPEGNHQVAYMDSARAAAQMKVGGEVLKGQGKELAKASVDVVPMPAAKAGKEKGKKGTPQPKKGKEIEPPQAKKNKEKEAPQAKKSKEKEVKTAGKAKTQKEAVGSTLLTSLKTSKQKDTTTGSPTSASSPPAASSPPHASTSPDTSSPPHASTPPAAPSMPANSGVDPLLLQDINSFMTWIKDPVGLGAYIDYVMFQNDTGKIAKLAEMYGKILKVFNIG